MKILLVGNYIHDLQTSMQLFAKMLEDGLSKEGHEVKLIRPEPFFGRIKPSYKGIGKWLGYIDKFFLFPIRLCKARSWVDVVHICDHSNAFYTRYLRNTPHIVTCHDLLAVRSARGEIRENPTRWTGRQLQRIILNGLSRAMHVVCISETTQKDLLRISNLNPANVSVVYYGFNFPYSRIERTKAKDRLKSLGINFDNPFILHVSKDLWYKNRSGVLEIFRYLLQNKETSHLNLIFAGDRLTRRMRKYIKRCHIEQKIFEVVFPNSEQLCALYSMAEAFLYPSLKEGFGWPIIEAQACGCPVFTTNQPPMTEVGGDAAIYINPEQPEEAARVIARNLSRISEIREVGFLNVKRFDTKNMIDSYVEKYKKLCGK